MRSDLRAELRACHLTLIYVNMHDAGPSEISSSFPRPSLDSEQLIQSHAAFQPHSTSYSLNVLDTVLCMT